MNFVLSCNQLRELDRRAIADYGIPSIVLMENAGRGIADKLCELGVRRRVCIFCGGGNNGGDGFVVARHLELRGVPVSIILATTPGKLSGDAEVNYGICRHARIPIETMTRPEIAQGLVEQSTWIVDALLGTGARGDPRPGIAASIDMINAAGKAVMAVDLPSGLECDTGAVASHCVRATHTCTLVAEKLGFQVPGTEAYTGEVHVLDIGVPRRLIEEVRAISVTGFAPN